MTGLIKGNITQESRPVPIAEVIVHARQRPVDPDHVKALRRSFSELGGQLQLQPIVVDGDLVLIDGAHRLEAARAEGWELIPALIMSGATAEDRDLLEAEANVVRKQLSPLELAETWWRFYQPAFQARTSEKQISTLKKGDQLPVTQNLGNGESRPLTLATAARETVGRSLDWLTKVDDIRQLAHSTTAPEALVKAANKGMQKLRKPGTKVEPIHKELLALQEIHSRNQEDAGERRLRELEKSLDRVLTETSLLAERLAGQLGTELHSAGEQVPNGAEQVRAIRVSLTHALASVVAIQCELEPEPVTALNRFGSEVTRSLSELTIARLGLEPQQAGER